METTNINTMPRIGDIAPEFRAVTTHGEINFPHDFKGKWKILFSHPGDFTPVCTSEFITFASMQRDFDILNCQLIGLSVDGVHSHIAWLRTIYEKIDWEGLKNVQVRFPVIADLNMEVARRYGMLQEHESSTATVRAVFFIDPDIIKTADWIIDLGPEGGDKGGNLVFEGTPEDLVKCHESFTAPIVEKKLN